MLTVAAILAQATPVEPIKRGIYFLIRAGRVVYVGQSVNVTVRIAAHAQWREFDSWSWVPCARADMNATERAYIDELMPEENADSMTRRLRWEITPRAKPEPGPPPAWVVPAWLAEVDSSDAEAEYAALHEKMRRLRAMRGRRR